MKKRWLEKKSLVYVVIYIIIKLEERKREQLFTIYHSLKKKEEEGAGVDLSFSIEQNREQFCMMNS